MNKTKLEVVRIDEDVIATSAVVKKGIFNGNCYYFIDVNTNNSLDDNDKLNKYYNGSGSSYNNPFVVGSGGAAEDLTYFNNAGTTMEFGKYYALYIDDNTDTRYFYECDEGHTHTDN